MNYRLKNSLIEILETIIKSYKFVKYMSVDEFAADDKAIFAIVRSLEIVGRRSRELQQQRKDPKVTHLVSKIPLRDIIGIEYKLNRPSYLGMVNPKILWETVKKDFPIIESEIRKILCFEQEKETVSEYIKICLRSPLTVKLTPTHLGCVVYPYLIAISYIQKVINQIAQNDDLEVEVKSISQNSPLNVSLKGATQATELIREFIIPWRREHAKSIAKLIEIEKLSDIKSKKADILIKRVNAVKEQAEAEKIRLENEKVKIELHRAKIQLAIDVLAQIAPDLPETEKISHIVRLLPQLDTLVSSELELDIIN